MAPPCRLILGFFSFFFSFFFVSFFYLFFLSFFLFSFFFFLFFLFLYSFFIFFFYSFMELYSLSLYLFSFFFLFFLSLLGRRRCLRFTADICLWSSFYFLSLSLGLNIDLVSSFSLTVCGREKKSVPKTKRPIT